jgi:hypothetical protein
MTGNGDRYLYRDRGVLAVVGTMGREGSGWGRFRVGELVWWEKSCQAFEDGTDGSETSTLKNQTPGIHPKDYSRYSKHGESLKSRTLVFNYSL